MHLFCEPLSADSGDACPIRDDAGRILARLWRQSISWACSDGRLELFVLASAPLPLPASEASEPVASALGRLHRAVAGTGALLLLAQPATAFGVERILLAAGVRLFGIASDADLSCWDAALSAGQPVFGVRGTVVTNATRGDALAMLSALAYGNFHCEEGLHLTRCDETPQGVDLETEAPVTATVVVRGGFEAAHMSGTHLVWRDQGHEGYVRLVLHNAAGTCWTQPRFVASHAERSHGHH